MRKLILAAFLMAMFAVSSIAQVTSLQVRAERFYQVDPSPQLIYIYVRAFNGETRVQEYVTIKVMRKNTSVKPEMNWLYTSVTGPDHFVSLIAGIKGTYTITATATNGVTGTTTYVIE